MRSVLGLQSLNPAGSGAVIQASTFSQRDCTKSSWISWNSCH